MLGIVHKYLGCPGKKVITIPDWMYTVGGRRLMKEQQKKNLEGGLNMVKFTELQCANQFIDKALGCVPLGVKPDDIDKAIGDSIRLCLEIMDKKVETLDMKGE